MIREDHRDEPPPQVEHHHRRGADRLGPRLHLGDQGGQPLSRLGRGVALERSHADPNPAGKIAHFDRREMAGAPRRGKAFVAHVVRQFAPAQFIGPASLAGLEDAAFGAARIGIGLVHEQGRGVGGPARLQIPAPRRAPDDLGRQRVRRTPVAGGQHRPDRRRGLVADEHHLVSFAPVRPVAQPRQEARPAPAPHVPHGRPAGQAQMAVVEGCLVFLQGEIPVGVAVRRLRPAQRQGQAVLKQDLEARIGCIHRSGVVPRDRVVKGPRVFGQGLAPVRRSGRGGGVLGGDDEGGREGGGQAHGEGLEDWVASDDASAALPAPS